jgi:single-stranded DNA-binding protein
VFDVAVHARIREDGEWKDYASFYRVVCFGRLADQALEHLVKGRKVCVWGTRQIMPPRVHNGRAYIDVEITAIGVEFLSAPSDVSAQPVAVGADAGQASGGVGSRGWDGKDLGFLSHPPRGGLVPPPWRCRPPSPPRRSWVFLLVDSRCHGSAVHGCRLASSPAQYVRPAA